MGEKMQYETIVGLEVHAQLQTKSKLFCGDPVEYGAAPNTNISPITLAHPGTLHKLNEKAVEYAIKMGLACNCTIEKENFFARKHYFYPDLPKGYQISQHTVPVCTNGFIIIKTEAGEKKISINRIHMEEDAGKSLHDIDAHSTALDYNRAGTALIEIVTEPDLSNGAEAYAYLTEIRKLVRYLGICDGNMEEGSLRCDANISVRKVGEKELGTKTEVKNLNSIRNVKRAIDAESERLIAILKAGGTVKQETRSYDAATNTSFSIREKEDADDYRYFPEPDLGPLIISDSFIKTINAAIPELPSQRIKRYQSEFQLSEYDATVLTEERSMADYFERLSDSKDISAKAAANWLIGPVRSWMNENGTTIEGFPIAAENLSKLISLVEAGKLSFTIASGKLFTTMLKMPDDEPLQLAERMNLLQDSDLASIEPVIDKVLEKFAGKVAEYKKGKKGLLALFVGEVMKETRGKADPKITNELLLKKLNT